MSDETNSQSDEWKRITHHGEKGQARRESLEVLLDLGTYREAAFIPTEPGDLVINGGHISKFLETYLPDLISQRDQLGLRRATIMGVPRHKTQTITPELYLVVPGERMAEWLVETYKELNKPGDVGEFLSAMTQESLESKVLPSEILDSLELDNVKAEAYHNRPEVIAVGNTFETFIQQMGQRWTNESMLKNIKVFLKELLDYALKHQNIDAVQTTKNTVKEWAGKVIFSGLFLARQLEATEAFQETFKALVDQDDELSARLWSRDEIVEKIDTLDGVIESLSTELESQRNFLDQLAMVQEILALLDNYTRSDISENERQRHGMAIDNLVDELYSQKP